MTTYKLPAVRLRRRYCTPCRFYTLAGLFVAVALQLGRQTAAAEDQLAQPITIDTSAGTLLEDALVEWGRKSGMTVMIDTQSITGLLTSEVHGTYNTGAALILLLKNSGLTFSKQGQIVHIIKTSKSVRAEKVTMESAELPSTTSDFALSASSSGGNESNSDSENSSQLEQVLVTATRKGEAERLQDVPVPISVISAQALMDGNKTKLEDYFDQIPGLMLAQSGPISMVSIRGITTGANNNPTVGYTLDDVPLGGSVNTTAIQVPAIDPADLAQVEVLRGPQGTLYGDNSMGGLIRYVTVDPTTERVFGDVRVGSDGVVGGTHLGYNTSAAVNLPLSDTLAIRISAFTRLDPGFVDDVETGVRGVNTTKTGGGRIVAKWTPSPDFSIKIGALYEKAQELGVSNIDVPTDGYPQTQGLGDLQQLNWWGTGTSVQEYKNATVTLNANAGGMKVTAISAYTFSGQKAIQDATGVGLNDPGTGTPLEDVNQMHKFTQEVRLTDNLGSHLEWLLGGFYNQEDISSLQDWSETAAITGAFVGSAGSIYYASGPFRLRESAGFGSLTWKATDRFDVQFGARESYLSTPPVSEDSYSGGFLNSPPEYPNGEPPGPSVSSPPSSEYWKDHALTYLVSPRFKLSPDLMVYARVANGFRPGSGTANPQPTDDCVVNHYQCLVHPDKTIDYEIGAKADLLDHTLSIDSSVYYIHWESIQLRLQSPTPGITYTGNGSGAKSQGVDLSIDWKPLEGLTISTWGAWNQAVLTQPFLYGAAGQPVPYSARFSGNFSVEKDVLITDNIHAFFAGKEIYMGDRQGEFGGLNAPRQDLPAYSQTDLNAGVKADPWTFNLYINNVTDRRGLLYGGLNAAIGYEFSIINPRTIGLSVVRTF